MYIPLNANVGCLDADFGHSTYTIINPVIPQVTHLVVKKTELPQRAVLVPISWVSSTTVSSIHLHCFVEDLEKRFNASLRS